jgi:rare lipoprotein A
MRRIDRTAATTLIALIASGACAAALATSACAATGAATGGSSAPSNASPGSGSAEARGRTSAIATWFGPGFYGQKTACGQTLTPAVVGVANRTLPCGTLVRLTYQGHVLTVPVLDRGPYSSIGAVWDLTAGAAEVLGIEDTVRIRARIVGSVPNAPTLGAPALSPQAIAAGGAQAG